MVPVQSRSTKAGAETPATALGDAFEVAHGVARSTKAGAETPATVPTPARPPLTSGLAQRRPGPKPRRQDPGRLPKGGSDRERSTKAGAETPATAPCTRPMMTSGSTLNEGRGRNPGDSANRRGDSQSRPAGPRLQPPKGPSRPKSRSSRPNSLCAHTSSPDSRSVGVSRPNERRSRPRITGGSHPVHTIQGWPTSRAGGRPRCFRASVSVAAKRYTITESRFGSITSWSSPIIRARRVGDRRHSKTDFWTRCP